jgi:predicted enzyme related to lactoylglutathione lyase
MYVKSIIPELVTKDIDKTIEFYNGILKLYIISKYPKEKPVWVKFGVGDSFIMFETNESIGMVIPELKDKTIDGSFNIYFEVENIERMYAEIKDSVDVIVHLIDSPFKQFAIKDVNGYILLIGQHN